MQAKGGHNGFCYNRRMYCGTINSYSRVERMNKFNTQKQTEETTEFQDNKAMHELNNEQQFTSMAQKRRFEMLKNELQTDEEFRLTAPEGENSDDDSIGELSTQDGIEYGFFLAKRG